jgi:pyruvate/2-oxoglutarate dehydrogenase complex dihydrolipoamide dehydrogenase (E3) component
MIAPAAVARQVRRAGEFGVRAAAPQADLAAVAGRKDRIAESIRSGSYHAAGRAEGLDFYQAEGRFTGLRRFRLPGNLVHEAVIAMVTGATRADIARPPSTSTPARVARQAHAQGCHAGSTRPADLDLSAQWKA